MRKIELTLNDANETTVLFSTGMSDNDAEYLAAMAIRYVAERTGKTTKELCDQIDGFLEEIKDL